MILTPELKAEIDSHDVYTLLYRVRFAPMGAEIFQGESGEYWMKRLAEVRAQDPAAYTAASKRMGW